MMEKREKVYQKTYQGYDIEIYRICKMTADGTRIYHYKGMANGCELPGEYDEYLHFPNMAEMFFQGMEVDFNDPSFAMVDELGREIAPAEVKKLMTEDINRNYQVENCQTLPQESDALKAAKEYCDREIEEIKILEERGDEMLVLKLSDSEVEILQRVFQAVGQNLQIPLQELKMRLGRLLASKKSHSS